MKRLRLLPIALVPAVVLGLAACSGSGSGSASSSPSATSSASASAAAITSCPDPGKASDSVKVSGAVGGGTAPKVSFAKGLSASGAEATVAVKGSGPTLKSGDYAQVAVVVYSAKDGTKIGGAGFDSGNAQTFAVGSPGFGAVLECAATGSRTIAVGPASAFNAGTSGDVVIVADALSKIPTKATGIPQQQDPALPTVEDKADGEPQITVPSGAKAPSKTEVEVLKQGDGQAIKDGDTALVQYKGVTLQGGKEFDSSWSKGVPTTFTVSEGQLIKGFVTGLVGQKVGSQVLIVTTAADAYGANPPEGSGIPANAPLVFVVDILALG
ncbi:FKBP-type peptidyl-prolyl cis-trans isomerase [Curtobacterium sp. NPDC089689]|uniref:FKBP-type peptidyl-prolyl cis-trans isomerase n=1 Tax=Curtobacterium sp. NPDC089689 TaxID=3363968 RepID=UPI00381B6B83